MKSKSLGYWSNKNSILAIIVLLNIIFPTHRNEAMLKVYRENSPVFTPTRLKWIMPRSHHVLVMNGSELLYSKFTGSFQPLSSLGARGLGASTRAESWHHSPLVLLYLWVVSSLSIQGHFLSPCQYLSLQALVFISISPHLMTLCPKHVSFPWAFKNTMLICFSWDQKSFPFLTLTHIFIYLLTVLHSCLFLLVMKETGCSSILVGFSGFKNMLSISVWSFWKKNMWQA